MLDKPVVLYMAAALIDAATPDPPGACCAKCGLYIPEHSACAVLYPPNVSPTGVCGLYAPGAADSATPMQAMVPPAVAGYVENGPTMCGTCSYFLRPSRCRIVKGAVEAGGCCNHWEPSNGRPR